MDLIFFDLDGTLLNKSSTLTAFTRETLNLLNEKGIANTVATGRTMLSAKQIIGDHAFELPLIFSNGVTTWDPKNNSLLLENVLAANEVDLIVNTALAAGITPFINSIDISEHQTAHAHQHTIYHSAPKHRIEHQLIENYYSKENSNMLPLQAFNTQSSVTNISMIGEASTIQKIWQYINTIDNLVAYSGPAIEDPGYDWMDVHHKLANKGSAVKQLQQTLGASNVICFGDSENDLSMFELADEAYAVKNAKPEIKNLAHQVIGHHHQDGVAHFLRERFNL